MKHVTSDIEEVIHAAIIDDDDEMRRGLRTIIEQAEGFVASILEAVQRLSRHSMKTL